MSIQKFPLSSLRQLLADLVARGGSYCELFGAEGPDGELARRGVPVFLCAHAQSRYSGKPATIPLPAELDGKAYRSLCERTAINKRVFPEVLTTVTINGVDHYLGWVNLDGAHDQDDGTNKDFFIVPVEAVDENA